MAVKYNHNNDRWEVRMPEIVANSFFSFERILNIFEKLIKLENQSILFDFKDTSWFDANLSSVLGALFISLLDNNNSVAIYNLSSYIDNILRKNNFLSSFGLESTPDIYNTTINFKIFNKVNKTEFQEYIDSNLLPKITIVMSEEFKYIFASNLDEIYQNARTHGDSSKIITCGQWYPKLKIVKFTICDIGLTIPENVRKKFPNISSSEAIDWATHYGTSTKPSYETGGLGLYNLKNFIEYNQGKMHIISGNGYWGYSGEISKVELNSSFNGTIVNLEINLNDKNIYYCMNELDIINNTREDNIITDLF